MAQKVNPTAYRLGIKQFWYSYNKSQNTFKKETLGELNLLFMDLWMRKLMEGLPKAFGLYTSDILIHSKPIKNFAQRAWQEKEEQKYENEGQQKTLGPWDSPRIKRKRSTGYLAQHPAARDQRGKGLTDGTELNISLLYTWADESRKKKQSVLSIQSPKGAKRSERTPAQHISESTGGSIPPLGGGLEGRGLTERNPKKARDAGNPQLSEEQSRWGGKERKELGPREIALTAAEFNSPFVGRFNPKFAPRPSVSPSFNVESAGHLTTSRLFKGNSITGTFYLYDPRWKAQNMQNTEGLTKAMRIDPNIGAIVQWHWNQKTKSPSILNIVGDTKNYLELTGLQQLNEIQGQPRIVHAAGKHNESLNRDLRWFVHMNRGPKNKPLCSYTLLMKALNPFNFYKMKAWYLNTYKHFAATSNRLFNDSMTGTLNPWSLKTPEENKNRVLAPVWKYIESDVNLFGSLNPFSPLVAWRNSLHNITREGGRETELIDIQKVEIRDSFTTKTEKLLKAQKVSHFYIQNDRLVATSRPDLSESDEKAHKALREFTSSHTSPSSKVTNSVKSLGSLNSSLYNLHNTYWTNLVWESKPTAKTQARSTQSVPRSGIQRGFRPEALKGQGVEDAGRITPEGPSVLNSDGDIESREVRIKAYNTGFGREASTFETTGDYNKNGRSGGLAAPRRTLCFEGMKKRVAIDGAETRDLDIITATTSRTDYSKLQQKGLMSDTDFLPSLAAKRVESSWPKATEVLRELITGKRSLSGTNIGISNSRSPEDAAEPRGLRTSQGRKTDSFSYISGSSALRLDPSALHPALRGVRRGRRAPSEPLAGPGISSSAPTRTPQGGGAGKLESIELSISRSKELRNTLFSIGGPYINWLIDAQSPQDHRSAGVQHESGAHRADPESNWATSGGVWGSAMSGKPYNGINGNPEYWYFKLNPETLRKSSAKFSPANLRKGYLNNLWLRHLNNTKISSNWENNNWTDAKRLLTQRYNWESLWFSPLSPNLYSALGSSEGPAQRVRTATPFGGLERFTALHPALRGPQGGEGTQSESSTDLMDRNKGTSLEYYPALNPNGACGPLKITEIQGVALKNDEEQTLQISHNGMKSGQNNIYNTTGAFGFDFGRLPIEWLSTSPTGTPMGVWREASRGAGSRGDAEQESTPRVNTISSALNSSARSGLWHLNIRLGSACSHNVKLKELLTSKLKKRLATGGQETLNPEGRFATLNQSDLIFSSQNRNFIEKWYKISVSPQGPIPVGGTGGKPERQEAAIRGGKRSQGAPLLGTLIRQDNPFNSVWFISQVSDISGAGSDKTNINKGEARRNNGKARRTPLSSEAQRARWACGPNGASGPRYLRGETLKYEGRDADQMGAKWEYRGCSQSSELKRLIGIHLEKAFRVGHSSQSVKPRLMGPSGQKNPELLNSRDLNGATQSGTGLKPFVFQWSHSCEARRASHVAPRDSTLKGWRGSRGNVINTGTLQRSHEKHTLGGPEYAEREKKNAIDPQGSKRWEILEVLGGYDEQKIKGVKREGGASRENREEHRAVTSGDAHKADQNSNKAHGASPFGQFSGFHNSSLLIFRQTHKFLYSILYHMILGQLVNETGKEKVMAKGLLEEAKQLRSTHFSHLHLTENESDRLSGSTGLYEINKLDATRAEPLRAQNRFSEGPNKDSSKGVANGDEHRANISNVPYGTSYGGDHSPYELGWEVGKHLKHIGIRFDNYKVCRMSRERTKNHREAQQVSHWSPNTPLGRFSGLNLRSYEQRPLAGHAEWTLSENNRTSETHEIILVKQLLNILVSNMRETNKETPFTVQQNKNLIPGTLVNKTDVHHLEESKTEGKTRTTPEAQTRNMLNGHDLNKRSITKNTWSPSAEPQTSLEAAPSLCGFVILKHIDIPTIRTTKIAYKKPSRTRLAGPMATFGPEGIQDTKGHTSLSPPEGGTEQVGLQGRDARKTGSEGPIVENSPVSAYFLHRPLGHLRSAPALRLYERYIPSGALHPVERGFGSWTHGDLENKTRGADKTPEAQRTPRSGEIQRPKDSSPEGRRERSAPQRHHLNGEFFGLTGGAESLRPVNTLRLSGLLSMYLFGHLVKGSEGPQGSSGQSPKSTGRSDSEQGNLIPSREAGTVVGFAIHWPELSAFRALIKAQSKKGQRVMKNYTDISPKGFESGHQTGKLQENSYRTQNGLEDARRALRDNFESTTLDIWGRDIHSAHAINSPLVAKVLSRWSQPIHKAGYLKKPIGHRAKGPKSPSGGSLMGSEGYKADYSGKSSGISSTAARHPSGFGYIKAQKNQYKLITEWRKNSSLIGLHSGHKYLRVLWISKFLETLFKLWFTGKSATRNNKYGKSQYVHETAKLAERLQNVQLSHVPFTDIPSGYKVRFQMREVPSHVYNAKMIGDYLRDQTSQDSERGPRNHKSLFKSILKRIKTDRN